MKEGTAGAVPFTISDRGERLRAGYAAKLPLQLAARGYSCTPSINARSLREREG